MTMIVPSFDDAIVVREADAEVLGWTQLSTRLLADSNATGGSLSVMRTTMGEGTEGARPIHIRSRQSCSISSMGNYKFSPVSGW